MSQRGEFPGYKGSAKQGRVTSSTSTWFPLIPIYRDDIMMELTWEAFDTFGADIRGAETIDKDVAKTLTSTAPTAIT